jgi:DNA modification methylase
MIAGVLNKYQTLLEAEMTPKIETRLVADLIPYAANSRTHSDAQVAQIAASIKEFGWTNPILIDGDNTIIAGHGRLLAARKLGLEEVPAIILDHLSKAQQRALVIADNQLALNAGWDMDMLKAEIEDLQLEDFDIDLLGFDDKFLDGLLEPEPTAGLTDEDAVPEVPETPKTVLGDVWVLGNHRLMCGDSTSVDAVDKLMNGTKADMVFTDPLYGVDYKGINNDDRSGLDGLLRGAFSSYLATSKSGASIYVFHSDKCADIFHSVFREFFHFSSMVIWAKNSLTLSRTDYQSQHEPCLYGWMKGGTHTFYGDRKQVSVWRFDKERVEGHTTPKPVALIERALSNSSKGGDIVSDLFGGSGSTMIACEKTNRHSRMMELDPKYCDVIIKRWQDFTGKEAIHAETGETFNGSR